MGSGEERWNWNLEGGGQVEKGEDGGRGGGSRDRPEPCDQEKPQVARGLAIGSKLV